MAAAIGGCNSLSVLPFDAAYNNSNEFAERMARNIQLILKSESYFDKIADASAGTYFIEELTEQLAEKAWSYFVEIEKGGGFIASLKKGTVQSKIKQFAAIKQTQFDEGKEVLVGTNKFPDAKENKKDKLDSIVWGDEKATGTTIEPLSMLRLSAANEKQRLSNL
jgi:methylmalonyl-CoA mutase